MTQFKYISESVGNNHRLCQQLLAMIGDLVAAKAQGSQIADEDMHYLQQLFGSKEAPVAQYIKLSQLQLKLAEAELALLKEAASLVGDQRVEDIPLTAQDIALLKQRIALLDGE